MSIDIINRNPYNRKIGPRALTSWPQIEDYTKILPSMLTNITNILNSELNIRSLAITSWTAISTSSKITSTSFQQIKDTIVSIRQNDINNARDGINTKFSWTDLTGLDLSVHHKIYAQMVRAFQSYTNTLQNTCICNCYYCTCNCDYCSCNCNHCSCNCNYCTCDCNYCCDNVCWSDDCHGD